METGLKDRVALISGGSRGLGLATAVALQSEGVRVALLARGEDDLARAAATLPSRSDSDVLLLCADVKDDDSVANAVQRAHAWHGRLNIVVNCAGPGFQPVSIQSAPASVLADTLDVKLLGFYRVAAAALPLLADDGTGRIINISGVTARLVAPQAAVTGITNAAVIAFTSYLASEAAARKVLVNAISPGPVLTEGWHAKLEAAAAAQGKTVAEVSEQMVANFGVRIGRWAESSEIANAVLFLASDLSSYITGRTLDIDGGMYKSVV